MKPPSRSRIQWERLIPLPPTQRNGTNTRGVKHVCAARVCQVSSPPLAYCRHPLFPRPLTMLGTRAALKNERMAPSNLSAGGGRAYLNPGNWPSLLQGAVLCALGAKSKPNKLRASGNRGFQQQKIGLFKRGGCACRPPFISVCFPSPSVSLAPSGIACGGEDKHSTWRLVLLVFLRTVGDCEFPLPYRLQHRGREARYRQQEPPGVLSVCFRCTLFRLSR